MSDSSRDRATTDDARWAAVAARDAAHDGAFVYAVTSTGVYCRPSCPSPRPRRERVRFFATGAEAAAAGFRACLRCRPERAETPIQAAVRRARERLDAGLDAGLDDAPDLGALAAEVGLSRWHLQRRFRALVGVSPREYVAARRAERLRGALRDGAPVSAAGYGAGYGSSRAVYEGGAARLGMTPGAYRRGGEGERVAFSTAPCALGVVLVAATARGVCAVRLGEDAAALEAEVRAEFPAAGVVRDDGGLAALVREALEHLEGRRPGLAWPLDLGGTAFQERVWAALREIPYGETRSYAALARDLGVEGGARAVAGACAANPAALVVPCHRVVRGDGSLSGYRWGVERKRALLEREAALGSALGLPVGAPGGD
jgi:AraC family transcriptional regulator of adaptative response/methylated-DNA-[protein]-cysteine methyltransferase